MVSNSMRYDQDSELIVRPVRQEDVEGLHRILSEPSVARQLNRLPSLTISQTADWLEGQPANEHRMVGIHSEQVVGFFNLNQFTRPRLSHTASIQIAVHPLSWNSGIGRELLTKALNLSDAWLNLLRVEALVLAENKRAINLVENTGFKLEGVKRYSLYADGVWHDEILYSRLLGQDHLADSQDQVANPLPESNEHLDRDPDIQIRSIHPKDVDDLHELHCHAEVCRTTLKMPSDEWWLTESKVNTHSIGLHRFVAVVEGKVRGVVTLNRNSRPGRVHTARIGMSVLPEYWNMGIGSLLLETVIDIADNWLGLKRIELDVNTDNSAAVHMYKKYCFKVEGTKRFHDFGNGRWKDSFVMSRIVSI